MRLPRALFGGPPAAEDDHDSRLHREWLRILDELERGLADAGRSLLSAGADEAAERPVPAAAPTWLPRPSGPIPPTLRARAEALLAAQHETAQRLQHELRETGRHLGALRSVPSGRVTDSAYLDSTA